MLHEFLTVNRTKLIQRCQAKNDARRSPNGTTSASLDGIPKFLDQLIRTLQLEQTTERARSVEVSGSSGGGPVSSEIGATATLHGRELSRQGFTFDQVVHVYGDLCQAISDLALERGAPISVDEFRTLNRCLDNGIADAVTEFGAQRVSSVQLAATSALNEKLGFLAHELRNHVHTATLAMLAIKAGHVGLTGATGAVPDRSLIGMRALIDRSLADVRSEAGLAPVARVITEVALTCNASADRIQISVSDHCGGLPSAPRRNICSSPSSGPEGIGPDWGWDWQSRGGASRRITGPWASAMSLAEDASSPSTCRAMR